MHLRNIFFLWKLRWQIMAKGWRFKCWANLTESIPCKVKFLLVVNFFFIGTSKTTVNWYIFTDFIFITNGRHSSSKFIEIELCFISESWRWKSFLYVLERVLTVSLMYCRFLRLLTLMDTASAESRVFLIFCEVFPLKLLPKNPLPVLLRWWTHLHPPRSFIDLLLQIL